MARSDRRREAPHAHRDSHLDKVKELLEAIVRDPDNPKLLAIQKDAALSVLSTQVKVDETDLHAQNNDDDRLAEIKRRLAERDTLETPRFGKTRADPKS